MIQMVLPVRIPSRLGFGNQFRGSWGVCPGPGVVWEPRFCSLPSRAEVLCLCCGEALPFPPALVVWESCFRRRRALQVRLGFVSPLDVARAEIFTVLGYEVLEWRSRRSCESVRIRVCVVLRVAGHGHGAM